MPILTALAHSSSTTAPPPKPAFEAGPDLVIFSGGTAFNPTARQLKRFTSNTLHLVPGFDSGGSSAKLRRAISMPAVGDLRSRLLALADESDPVSNTIRKIMARRLRSQPRTAQLHRRMAAKVGDLIAQNQAMLSSSQVQQLLRLLENFPKDLEIDLERASIGNLALVSAYLWHDRDLDAASQTIGRLLGVRGEVQCSANEDLHLACRLADGRVVLGQHQITGKETEPLREPIRHSWLCTSLDDASPVRTSLRPHLRERLNNTDLIVLAPGSFHSSIASHLLIDGMPQALARRNAPLVYIPNLGHDPELVDDRPAFALELLLERLTPTVESPGIQARIDYILADPSQTDAYDQAALKRMKIQLVPLELKDPEHPGKHCPRKLSQALLKLAKQHQRLAY